MQVLVHLAEHAGDVVSREEILEAVWSGTYVNDEVLTTSIRDLRRALGDDPKDPRFIKTFPKKGYRLLIPVSFVEQKDTDLVTPTGNSGGSIAQPRTLETPGPRAALE